MPTKTELAKFSIRGTASETAANTFTQSTINTNLQVEGNNVFFITGVWMSIDITPLVGIGDACTMQVCYSSQSALIGLDDPDWLMGRHVEFLALTSGGGTGEKMVYQDVKEFPLAQSQLFLGVQGTSLSAALTAKVKIEGYLQRVSTTDFFRIQRVR